MRTSVNDFLLSYRMRLSVLDLLFEARHCVGGLDIDLDDMRSQYIIECDDGRRTWKTLPFVVLTVSFGMMGKIGKPERACSTTRF